MFQFVTSPTGIVQCKNVTTQVDANGTVIEIYSEPYPLQRCNGLSVAPRTPFRTRSAEATEPVDALSFFNTPKGFMLAVVGVIALVSAAVWGMSKLLK